jgi:hypothetical protein
MSKTALVITSISSPNPAIRACAEGSGERGFDFILVGDVSSPAHFDLNGCDYWSIERQRTLSSRLARMLPEKHYARKNIGYLIAIGRGADTIIETDDDNFPYNSFWENRSAKQKGHLLGDCGWVNIYRFFADSLIWPRGFPLEYIHAKQMPQIGDEKSVHCPIQQGLTDRNPDVDAVYRLVMPLPQSFSKRKPIALGRGTWSSFNSQNTTWFKEAFPLLYLPSYCSFRMCDIWRSFVALRICWENNWFVLFHEATVFQERNKHDLLQDLKDEFIGYVNNASICEDLEKLDIAEGPENLDENLRICYELLISRGLLHKNEMKLIDCWLSDLKSHQSQAM